ncbi:MAG: PepSY domain-containing protein [Dehalococcoidia bacterium]|nr:PepSY domain-containing protein [Dehalococcoidia bacterium]MCB9484891.1 PepSY domain-containing protein [Thermoflexaceae bacterium]
MYRILERRLLLGVSAVALLALAGGAITALTQGARAGGNDDEAPVAPGTLDDGAELLPLAGITLDEAIAAAQTAASGSIGEVDLEYWKTGLVFNVDVGNKDVKVDAATGEVVGAEDED